MATGQTSSRRKPASKPDLKKQHAEKADAWVRKHLAGRYSTHPAKVDPKHRLKDWGHGDEKSLADIAGSFNRATKRTPMWRGADIAPPDLISKLKKNPTVGSLTDVLAETTFAQRAVPSAGTISDDLMTFLKDRRDDPISLKTKLGTLRLNEVDANRFGNIFGAKHGFYIRNLVWDEITKNSSIEEAGINIHRLLTAKPEN